MGNSHLLNCRTRFFGFLRTAKLPLMIPEWFVYKQQFSLRVAQHLLLHKADPMPCHFVELFQLMNLPSDRSGSLLTGVPFLVCQ